MGNAFAGFGQNRPEYGTPQNSKVMDFFRGPDADMNKIRLAGVADVFKGNSVAPHVQQIQGMQQERKQSEALEGAMGGLSPAEQAILGTLPPGQQAQYMLNQIERKRAAGQASAAAAQQAQSNEAFGPSIVLVQCRLP